MLRSIARRGCGAAVVLSLGLGVFGAVGAAPASATSVTYCAYPVQIYAGTDCYDQTKRLYDFNRAERRNKSATFSMCQYMTGDFTTPYVSYSCSSTSDYVYGWSDDRGYAPYPNNSYWMAAVVRNNDQYNYRYITGYAEY